MFPFSKVFLGHPPSSTIIQLLPLNSGVVNPSAANTKVFHENVHLNQFLRLFNKLSHKSFPLYSTVSITVKPWKFGPLLKVGVLFDILEFWQWFWMFRVLRQNSSRIFTVVDAEMRNSGHYSLCIGMFFLSRITLYNNWHVSWTNCCMLQMCMHTSAHAYVQWCPQDRCEDTISNHTTKHITQSTSCKRVWNRIRRTCSHTCLCKTVHSCWGVPWVDNH